VVMHSSNEEVAASIEEFKTGVPQRFSKKAIYELDNQNN
jgi:hypothetical protein